MAESTKDISNNSPRDRFVEGRNEIISHFSDKILAMIRQPEFVEQLHSILDPLISHVINRVFPYILLCSILFLVMLLVTVSTFIIVVRGSLAAFHSVDMAMKIAAPGIISQ
jgi:hypothetical protein